MLQIIEEQRKPSFKDQLGQALGNIGMGAGQALTSALKEQEEQKAFSREFGKDIRGFSPEQRKLMLAEGLKAETAQKKNLGDIEKEKKDYESIQQYFGKKFADVWKAAPVGGRTKLVEWGIDSLSRGESLDEQLSEVEVSSEEPARKESSDKPFPQMKDGKLPKDMEWPDYAKRPKHYTPKGWDAERSTWRKENFPLFESNKDKSKTLFQDKRGISKLTNLNESRKVGEGFERALINPETGEFYGLAQLAQVVSPEAQEWVKEIARFQNRAKDAFGSRVTNFDLQSYMKQFPGLLNTYEGRKRILEMMRINNDLDSLYSKALGKVYEKYGLNGISPENAESLAQKLIQDETEKLNAQYLGYDSLNQQKFEEMSQSSMIEVVGPDGLTYEVDEKEVELLPEGFRLK